MKTRFGEIYYNKYNDLVVSVFDAGFIGGKLSFLNLIGLFAGYYLHSDYLFKMFGTEFQLQRPLFYLLKNKEY